METIKIQQLDYKYILIEKYKSLGLTENELVILLVIDNFEKDSPSLITADQLALKMNLEEGEIDKVLASLFDKKFLDYETFNGIMVTSLKPTKQKILDAIKKEWLMSDTGDLIEVSEEDGKSVFELFTKKLNRSLTPMELDSIRDWLAQGVSKEVIVSALNECSARSKRITIRAVDKMIIKMLSSSDIKKEGYSVINEHNKKNIDETIEIVSFDWINNK